VVEPFGDEFLAGSSLANDEYRALQRSGPARPFDRV
jgi:hypothetical protein